ncbi:amino acid racemase [Candidatus Woesearchaeota archaeon]|nr:amino acid racemase [Candidatus Woesearchaeota archaeon]
MICDSIQRLSKAGAHVIAIPCNTVHVFLDELRPHSPIPVMSILEETSQHCVKLGFQKVGLLGSGLTIQQGLHARELTKHSISVVVPEKEDQAFINGLIRRIITGIVKSDDKARLQKITMTLVQQGAQAVILGCTDLPLLLAQEDVEVPLVDTRKVLEHACATRLMSKL